MKMAPFGNIDYSKGSSDNTYQFTGKEIDPESGLTYFGARYYNPIIERWISQDKLAGKIILPQSLNRYSFNYNNPLKYIDLDGFDSMLFNGRIITYIQDDGTTFTVNAVSGLKPIHKDSEGKDYTKPEYQKVPDKGPIPEGSYSVNPKDIEEADPKTGKYSDGDDATIWGQSRVRIRKNIISRLGSWISRKLGLNTREGFFLHHDVTQDGTAGCIGIQSQKEHKKVMKAIKKHKGAVPLKVEYKKDQPSKTDQPEPKKEKKEK